MYENVTAVDMVDMMIFVYRTKFFTTELVSFYLMDIVRNMYDLINNEKPPNTSLLEHK